MPRDAVTTGPMPPLPIHAIEAATATMAMASGTGGERRSRRLDLPVATAGRDGATEA
jgi:hypothetical protein